MIAHELFCTILRLSENKCGKQYMSRLSVRLLLLLLIVVPLPACTTIRAVQTIYSGKPTDGLSDSVVPFTLQGHPILIETTLNNSPERYTFVLDTGAITAIRPEIAEDLGLSKGIAVDARGSGGNSKRIRLTTLDSVAVGDMEVRNTAAGIMDLTGLYSLNVSGILGSNFLRYFKVTIDYQKHEIRLSRNIAAVLNNERGSIIPFGTDVRSGFSPSIECKIDGDIKTRCMLDTGAVGVSLPESTLKSTRAYRIGNVIRANGSMSAGMFGTATHSKAVHLDELTIGGVAYTSIPATSHAGLEYVLLGNEFLRNFTVTLNYPAEELVLKPVRAMFVHHMSSYGLALTKENGKTIVAGTWEGSSAAASGLQPGDRIVRINSEDVAEKAVADLMVQLLDDKRDALEIQFIGDNGVQETVLHKKDLLPAVAKGGVSETGDTDPIP